MGPQRGSALTFGIKTCSGQSHSAGKFPRTYFTYFGASMEVQEDFDSEVFEAPWGHVERCPSTVRPSTK